MVIFGFVPKTILKSKIQQLVAISLFQLRKNNLLQFYPQVYCFYANPKSNITKEEIGNQISILRNPPFKCLRKIDNGGHSASILALSSMCTGSVSGSESDTGANGWSKSRGVLVKTLVLIGGALLLKRLTKSTTHRDHLRIVADSLAGEKFSKEQASRDSDNYFNLRWIACPAAELVDGSRVLYFEKGFWRNPRKPFRQRFFMVKPCPKEMKCDVELSTYAIRDSEEYMNFCDRSKDQRPQPEEVIADIAEHLTTIYLKRCDRGKRLYEGSTPSDGFPNTWNGASYCTTEFAVLKNGEIHSWDRGYDEKGNQIWGVKGGPYEFKPAPASSSNEPYSALSLPQFIGKRIEGSFVIQE